MTSIDSKRIFGGEVQYFRLDPKHWDTVLKKLADTGIRCCTSYVQWGTHLVGPPDADHPAGVLDFEGRTDPQLDLLRFLDLVHKHGLDLNFRSGPFCCNEMAFGGYPKWLVCGDPNMMVWDHQNRTTQGYWIARKEGSQPSYLHPEYLEWCRRWIAEVDKVVAPRLASNGGFITMVNLDNEVSYIVKDSFLDSDYNPVNVGSGGFYHQFLSEKYGDVTAVPYEAKFRSIEDIAPPREVPADISSNPAWYFDWVEFKEWCMCRYLGELRAMHVANGVEDVTFMTNFNPHLPEGVPTRMPSFEKAVKGPDGKGRGIVGYDFYRGTFLSWSGYCSMARVLRLMNASVDYTWSAEFMSGTWQKILASRVSDDHMRFMARCALANGCKAISWFMFHDRRVWGDAPVSAHGHRRTSWEVLRETYDLCANCIPHWDSLVVRGDCAVIYDIVHHRHTSVGDPSPCNDSASHLGSPTIHGAAAGATSREYYGLHRLVEACGHQPLAVDIIARPGALDQTKLAFYPGSPVASHTASEALRTWVDGGGTLVVTGPWPVCDEAGRPMDFLGCQSAGEQTLGLGRILHREAIGQSEPEEEDPAAVDYVRGLIRNSDSWHVALELPEPVQWETWAQGGGVTNAGDKFAASTLDNVHKIEESRIFASAILHEGDGFPVLFVLNHFPEAAELQVVFNGLQPKRLTHLVTGESFPVESGRVILDVDRKAGEIYRVEL